MQKLSHEADLIYDAIFKERIPDTIKQRFEHASRMIDGIHPQDEVKRYYHYLHNVKDLEALELVARHSGRLPVITEKFKVMMYISETFPGNYHFFVNERSCFIFGYLLLFLSLVRSGYKLAKGMILFAVH